MDRRNNFVWLSTTRDEEPVFLTQHLSDTDSMLASVADPQRAPEMLAVREAVRGWRFYDQFRTDSESPARAAQIGTWTPILHHDGSNLAAHFDPRRRDGSPERRLNEPETSLHPDLLPALARLILAAAAHTQIIVVSHAQKLIEILTAAPLCTRLHLLKDFGETTVEGTTLFSKPKWEWPAR